MFIATHIRKRTSFLVALLLFLLSCFSMDSVILNIHHFCLDSVPQIESIKTGDCKTGVPKTENCPVCQQIRFVLHIVGQLGGLVFLYGLFYLWIVLPGADRGKKSFCFWQKETLVTLKVELLD